MHGNAIPGGAIAGRLVVRSMLPRAVTAATAFLACLMLVACGEGSVIVGPRDLALAGDPQVHLVSGGGQEAEVGTFLPQPIVVEVTDSSGAPVRNATLAWVFTQGGGRAEGATTAPEQSFLSTTNASGKSVVRWQLGTEAGDQQASVEIVGPSAPGPQGPSPAPGNGRKVGWTARAKSGPADSISITPDAPTLTEGKTQQFTVSVVDRYGNPVEDQAPNWSVSDSALLRVDSTGMVSALAPGSALVYAAIQSASASEEVTIQPSSSPPPPSGTPGNVTDLQAVSTTESSVTLRWTEVGDGTGSPAHYTLRHGSPTISWASASATEVIVNGTKVGATIEYTWGGLPQSTDHQFQLVSYRGTLNVDATFGALSNVASASTDSSTTLPPPPPPPGSGGAYPHQPSGLSTVFRADGTVNQWPDVLESSAWLQYVTPVADPTNPAGTGSSLEAVTVAGRAAPGIAETDSFGVGPKGEWYIMYRIFYDPNYENHGHKLFYVGMANGARKNAVGPSQMYLTREPDGRVRFLTQNVQSTVLAQTSSGAMTFGQWHEVELRLVEESAPGAGDGVLQMWFDGTFVGQSTNVQWTPSGASTTKFDGMYLWMQSNDTNTRTDYYRIGEFYISGR